MIYVDYNATAPLKEEIALVLPSLIQKYYGNPSSLHTLGRDAKACMEQARSRVSQALNASSAELFFTSGGTESDALGLYGVFQTKSQLKKILVSEIEHSAILGQEELFTSADVEFIKLPVLASGVLDLDKLEKTIDKQPVFLSLMLANNETGVVQPVEKATQLVKQYGGLVHCDAVQAFGKIPVNVEQLGVDSLSISGHKIGALRGIGALFVKKVLQVQSFFGKGSQEKGFRPGTENLPGIIALGLASEELPDWASTYQHRMWFENKLKENFSVKIAGEKEQRVPNTSSISFQNKNQDLLLAALDMQGICASAGSACKANLSLPSHVLKAMGYTKEELKGVVRFSFGPHLTKEQIEKVYQALTTLLT